MITLNHQKVKKEDTVKARIIDLEDLKKKPEQREAEQLLTQLSPGKAIEVTLSGDETPRKVSRLYRKAASNVGKAIRVMTKEGKVIVSPK